MGFDVAHIASSESHYSAFVCAICQNLVGLSDALTTTPCSHVFCHVCLRQWLERGQAVPTCPTCNHDLSYSSNQQQHHLNHLHHATPSMMMGGQAVMVQPLQTSQPLAYRVLHQVQVHCPLRRVGCTWQGDYGDLQAHLLSSTAHCSSTTPSLTNIRTMITDEGAANESNAVTSDDHPTMEELQQQQQAQFEQQQYALAMSFKEEANSQFSSGEYTRARELYTKALNALEQPSFGTTAMTTTSHSKELTALQAALYCNRAATLYETQQFYSCIDDCAKAIQLDPRYVKAYVRQGRAYVQLGLFDRACATLQDGLQQHQSPDPNSVLAKELRKAQALLQTWQLGLKQMERSEYASAKATFGALLRTTTKSITVLYLAAKADLALGLVDSVLRLSLQILQLDAHATEGFHLRGLGMFLMGNDDNELEQGIRMLKQAIRLNPDDEDIKTHVRQCTKIQGMIKTARNDVFHRRFQQASDQFDAAIMECQNTPYLAPPKTPLMAMLHTERAQAQVRLQRYDQALKDCAKVIYNHPDYIPAWLIQWQALHGLGRHEDVLTETIELLHRHAEDLRIRAAYEKADFEVRKSRRPDFYQLLGVSPLASEMEIKKAYKVKALQWHPDKWTTGTDDEKKKAQEQFQLLGEALEVLCDDFKRQLYDGGYDMKAIRERVAMVQQAAKRN